MTMTKDTITKINDKIGADVANIKTVADLLRELDFYVNYHITEETDILGNTIHYIETTDGDIIAYETEKDDGNRIAWLWLE